MHQQRDDDHGEQHAASRRRSPAACRPSRCSARSTMKAPNRRPPQIRCAESHLRGRVVEGDEAARRVLRRQHAGRRRARQRRDRGAGDQVAWSGASKPDGISSNCSSSSSTTNTATGMVSARRANTTSGGERIAVAPCRRGSRRSAGATIAPARTQMPPVPKSARHANASARRAALVARIGDPVLAELDETARHSRARPR